ncbi:uncharacterized protein JCM6883_005447 [Sporobolomyces salmoneus]|uniref:uncharacterized protein n=1 Tax=Sporobolomyces salmoneus TaxID=183962 RepID=UPI00317A1F30
MLNDRITDELLALESIFPDSVSWTERPGGYVDLNITINIQFEQPQTVEVTDIEDQAEPETLSATSIRTKDGQLRQPLAERKEEQTSARSQSRISFDPDGNGQKSRKARTAPAPQLVSTRKGSSKVDIPTRTLATNTLPDPARSRPLASSIPLSHSKTPRISIAPRPPSPPPPVHEIIDRAEALSDSAVTGPRILSLEHLPPVLLSIELPPDYPESSGPSKVDLRTEGNWLPESKRLKALEKLNEVYVGDECLFGIAELLSSASPDFSSTLSLSNPIVLMQNSVSSSSMRLSDFLFAYNRSASSTAFSTSSHLCPLCFAPRKGSNCLQLESCGCTFCIPCLKDYFSLLITEGMVRSVACPAIECVEKRAKWEKTVGGSVDEKLELEKPGRVSAQEVEILCGVESRKRFEWLKEKIRVESGKLFVLVQVRNLTRSNCLILVLSPPRAQRYTDPSISFCPRESCQAPTPKLDDDKLRVCGVCSFAFCVFCRKGWHGTRNACALPQSTAIVTKFLEADDDEKRIIEQRYGAANIKRLVAAFEEEKALQEWFEKNSQSCPGCQIRVEKSHGCNHMTCGKCRTHFCYRCGKSISPTEPYRHFNTPSSICYGKLFDFSPGQEPGIEEWIGEIVAQDENAH